MSELSSNNKRKQKIESFKVVQFMWLNLSYSEFIYFDISMMEYNTNTSSHYYSIQPIYSKPAQNLDVISKKNMEISILSYFKGLANSNWDLGIIIMLPKC